MNPLIYLVLIIPVLILLFYMRFRLSGWKIIVKNFPSAVIKDISPIFGFWSEFRRSPKSYPLGNNFLKAAVIPSGLYLQYNLKYEPVKFYKPVLIPWIELKVKRSKESLSKGFDEYIITKDGNYLGTLFLQISTSEKIKEEIKKLGIILDEI